MKKTGNIVGRVMVGLLVILFVRTFVYTGTPHVQAAKAQKKKRLTYSRDYVRKAQMILIKKGYNPGVADGLWGGKTASALRKFQKKEKLKVTGTLDYKTTRKLFKQ